jgi:hypothetical protein
MAISNHERIGKALGLLKDGLRPFVERELKAQHGDGWAFEVKDILVDRRLGDGIAHLAGLVGAEVTVTLEIEARIPAGASDHLVRTVTENSRTL